MLFQEMGINREFKRYFLILARKFPIKLSSQPLYRWAWEGRRRASWNWKLLWQRDGGGWLGWEKGEVSWSPLLSLQRILFSVSPHGRPRIHQLIPFMPCLCENLLGWQNTLPHWNVSTVQRPEAIDGPSWPPRLLLPLKILLFAFCHCGCGLSFCIHPF